MLNGENTDRQFLPVEMLENVAHCNIAVDDNVGYFSRHYPLPNCTILQSPLYAQLSWRCHIVVWDEVERRASKDPFSLRNDLKIRALLALVRLRETRR